MSSPAGYVQRRPVLQVVEQVLHGDDSILGLGRSVEDWSGVVTSLRAFRA